MIYDGSDLSGKVIGNDTGDFNDQEFYSNGTDMFINFISDANSDSVSTGFNASYSIGIYTSIHIYTRKIVGHDCFCKENHRHIFYV